MTAFTASGKPKRAIDSMNVERRYRNVIPLFLSGQLPNFTHQRHVHVANILRHPPYGRELMHLGLQTMTYRQFVVGKYSAEITDPYWSQLDEPLPDPAAFDDLPGGVVFGSMLQDYVPDKLRGRAFTLIDMDWSAFSLLSLATGALVVDAVGIRAVFWAGGVLLAAAGLLGLALLGKHHRLDPNGDTTRAEQGSL